MSDSEDDGYRYLLPLFPHEQPYHEGMLNLDQLVPNMWVDIHYKHHGDTNEQIFRCLVLATPLQDAGGVWIWLQDKLDGRASPRKQLAADLGLVPYADGSWNPFYYITLSEVQG